MIRLTSEKAFDALIEYLEPLGLRWPQLQTQESYRDWFIRETKALLATDTILVEVQWMYNPETGYVEVSMCRRPLGEIDTDEEYLAYQKKLDEEANEALTARKGKCDLPDCVGRQSALFLQ